MQEETRYTSKPDAVQLNLELMARIMETDRNLAVLQAQIRVLERTYLKCCEKGCMMELEALEQIFGFEPPAKAAKPKKPKAAPNPNKVAGAAKARAAKATKKAAEEAAEDAKEDDAGEPPAETPAEKLRKIAEKRKAAAKPDTGARKATPKDYTAIRAMQQDGLSVDDIAKELGVTKESIMKVLNYGFNDKISKPLENKSFMEV